MTMENARIAIKHWSSGDQPRERLLSKGVDVLSDAELLGILINSGNREHSALDLAHNLVRQFGDLKCISKAGVAELMQVKGIGKAKAVNLAAAFELSRRSKLAESFPMKVNSTQKVARYLENRFGELPFEIFHVIFVNKSHFMISERTVASGGVSAVHVDVKRVMHEAIRALATGMILCHNHPSGALRASKQDIVITEKIIYAARLLEVKVLDHIIVSPAGSYSFLDSGLLAGYYK